MVKQIFKCFVAFFLLIFVIVLPAITISDASSAASAEAILDAEEEQINSFDNFELIEKGKFIELINNGEIETVGKYGQAIYVTTKNHLHFAISDDAGDLVPYLMLNGYEVLNIVLPSNMQTVLNETKPVETAAFENAQVKTFIWIGAGILFSCLFVALRARIYSQQKAYTNTGSTDVESSSQEKRKVTGVPGVKFSDVEGLDELKTDIIRLVDCLKNPKKYQRAGARPPKGVILYGPPGTGKTLIARAIAGEAGVPFISAVGSDFVEKYVGVGAKRVRELYSNAKKQAPCIVFIDEVDAVASQRGNDKNSEQDNTINALLSELDGFKGSEGIITICATNRLDMLDSAFKRAGRFDLKLAVGLPDKTSRYKILKIHSSNKSFEDDVSLEALANRTSCFSGAELEALLNEAAMLAADDNRIKITLEDIDNAFFKIVMQGNKKKREKIDEMNRIVAWHEAGHTLATKLLTDDNVSSVTIVGSSSGAGGVTFRNPKEEGLHSKKYLKNLIKVMYAGRAAEQIYTNDEELITDGASQDIKQATGVIKEYLALYGMGNLGMLDMTQLKPDFGNIIEEASELSKAVYAETLQLLKDNKNILEKLAKSLLEKETLEELEIDQIIQSAA